MDLRTAQSNYTTLFQVIAFVIVTLFTLACLMPLLLILSGSFTDNTSIIRDGYHLFPKKFSLEGYGVVIHYPAQVLRAYGVTILTTIAGTALGLFLITMTGYVLHRKDFKYRNKLSFYIYFTTLFSGGLVPWYMLITKYLHMTDTYWVLIIPMMMNPFLIILMKNFMSSTIPDVIIESAKIDGAGDFLTYCRIVLPLSISGIATIGLFLALQYWNDWFMTSLFINDPLKYQLQYYLYNFINNILAIQQLSSAGASITNDAPAETTKMALTIIVTGPIIFLYPFVQRFFIKGLTIGAVKG